MKNEGDSLQEELNLFLSYPVFQVACLKSFQKLFSFGHLQLSAGVRFYKTKFSTFQSGFGKLMEMNKTLGYETPGCKQLTFCCEMGEQKINGFTK